MSPSDSPRSPSGDDSGRRLPSAAARVAVSRAVSEGARHIRAVKGCYIGSAVLVGFALLLSILIAPTSVVTIVLGGLFVVAVASAFLVERAPVPFTLLAAIGTTLVAIPVALVFGLSDAVLIRAQALFTTVLAAAFWVAFGLARRYAAVLRRNADLVTVRHVAGARVEVSVEGVGTRHRDQARRDELAHRRRRRLFVGAALALFAVTVALVAHFGTEAPAERPPLPPPAYPVDSFLAAFRAHWNADRLDGVKRTFLPESREKFSRGIDAIVKRRGWKPLPALGEPRRTDEGRFAAAWFPLADGGGELYTSWAYDEPTRSWGINALRPPKDD